MLCLQKKGIRLQQFQKPGQLSPPAVSAAAPVPGYPAGIFSCADAIARVIEKRMEEGILNSNRLELTSREEVVETEVNETAEINFNYQTRKNGGGNVVGVCPDCGDALIHQEGCMVCMACGYSKC